MGITSALYSGVSGLNTNSQAMSVIGNNLANTGTIGFKGSKTVFSDLLSSTISGSGGASQVGRGVGISKVDNIFSQGTFESTANNTDLAIEGEGFFMVKKGTENDATYYTRAGAFGFNQDGYLTNPEGLRVQGKAFDLSTGVLVAGNPGDILVNSAKLVPGKVTDTLSLHSNLDASTAVIPAYIPASADYVPASSVPAVAASGVGITNPSLTFTADTAGTAANAITIVLENNAAGGAGGTATLAGNVITVQATDITALTTAGIAALINANIASGAGVVTAAGTNASAAPEASIALSGGTDQVDTAQVGTAASGIAFDSAITSTYDYATSTQIFDTLGNPHLLTTYFRKDPAINTWDWYWGTENAAGAPLGNVTGSAPMGQIIFNTEGTLDTTIAGNGTGAIAAADLAWGNGSADTGITLTFDTTQFNNPSKVISQEQNGYTSGNLTNIAVNNEGTVVASYSNGKQDKIATIALAKFTNPSGLTLVGGSLFKATTESGSPRVGLPGPELGKIFTNSLEQSNVDMGKEFVDMITVQRSFQANSKIITTIDGMLDEVINLKR